MAQPVVEYDGNYITCYPSSNAADNGKLQLEFNMARLVTRVSSKNFCVKKPSFELKATEDPETLVSVIQVGPGEASINGMDLITTQTLTIEHPETEGEYYLALKLARDSSENVLGDLVYGTSKTFKGVYLTYFNEKDETDKDILYLGKINWDGTQFTDIEEDEDKYGRIWAEDILCKIEDPKHPDVSRLLLQEWLYKVPDWYFSKEGDVIYGKLEMLPGRDGSNKPGISMEAEDEDTSEIIVKAPSIDDDKKILIVKGTEDGTSISLGNSIIEVNEENNYELDIKSDENIVIKSDKVVQIKGDMGVEIGAGGTAQSPKLTLKDHKATFTDSNSNDLKYDIYFKDEETIQQTLGKAIWQYSDTTKDVSLLATNVNNLDINPNGIFRKNLRVIDTISLGENDSLPQTTLSRLNWTLSENKTNGKTIVHTPESIIFTNPTLSEKDNQSILLKNSNNTIHTQIFDDGKIELLNNTRNPSILWKDGGTSYDVTLEKIIGQKKLNLIGDLDVINIVGSGTISGTGLITTNGSITFKRGSNDATLTKDNNSSALRTSADLIVGTSGTSNLTAGNTTIKGSAKIGSSSQCVIDANGNIDTSGTVRGTKIYNAVYNDYAETLQRSKEEQIEPGDLVYVREDGLVGKVTSDSQINSIIGICSDTAGVILGGKDIPEDERVIVGFVGQIWTKTLEQNIKPGQMLKVNKQGTLSITTNRSEKFAISLSNVVDGKVKVLYNG